MSFGASHSSSQPVDMTPPAYQALQQPYANVLQGLLDQFSSNPTAQNNLINGYQGPLTTPTTANENTTLQQLQNLNDQNAAANSGPNGSTQALSNIVAQGSSPQSQASNASYLMGQNQNPTSAQTSTGYLQDLNGASGGAYSSDPNNPIVQAAIQAAQRPTQQALDESLTRDLPGRFAMSGQQTQPQSSSAFDRAAAIATRGSADALGDIATNISYQNLNDANNRAASALGQYTTGQQAANQQTQQLTSQAQNNQATNAISAAGQQSQIQASDVNSMISNLQAQALPRLIQDLGVERGMEAFNSNITSLLAGLGLTSSTTQPTVANSSDSSSAQVGTGMKLK